MEHDAEQLRVSRPPADRPVLVYDGECGFCKRWVARWKGMTLGRVDYEPFQQAAERFAEVPLERFEHGVQLIFPDGRVVSGAHAVFNLYAIAGVRRWPLWMYEHAPGFEQVTEAAYAFVGRHRGGFATLDRLAFGKHPVRSTYHFSEWLFLRLLGVIYLIAFLSLGVQMDGLIGSKGILPAAEFIGTFQRGYGNALFWRVPTLCWFNCSDGFLHLLCWGGAALAVLLIAGIAPAVTTALLWICYLSLVHVGQVFLGYQWDALLLETGFLAIFFAPWVWWSRPGHQPRTSRTIFLLQRLLLFRLMFFSGMAKLLSGDATWRQWRALDYHYQTQPLPTWVGWYAHQLPAGIHQLSVGIMFVIELIIPFLYFMPRRLRMAGFWWTMTLQVLIALTGNYGFFNLLAIVLCVPLLDDAFWPRWLRERITCWRESCLQKQWWRWPGWIIAPLAAAILLVTWVRFDELLG
ncbi:MAG TPA: lipase maturation factor family protein, partial [Tepidisphaeraceae bacterium]